MNSKGKHGPNETLHKHTGGSVGTGTGTLYHAEENLKEGLSKVTTIIQSVKLQDILKRYLESCDHKRSKIDRVFSYLSREPSRALRM